MYNKMEHTLNHGMCRCCASEGMFKNFSATYQWMGADEVYSDMLKECFDITLTNAEDCNNGGICEVCITQLRNASNFKKQVLQTEEQFKKMVQDNLLKSNIVKVEHSKDDDVDSEPDNLSDPDYSGAEFEVPVKEEVIEPRTRKRAAKASTSSAKKAKTEDGEPSSKRTFVQQKGKTLMRAVNVKMEEKPVFVEVEIEKVIKQKDKEKFKTIESEFKTKDVLSEDNSTEESDTVRPKKPCINYNLERKKLTVNVSEILTCSNATLIGIIGRIGYVCCYCNEEYPDPANLKKHNLELHTQENTPNFIKNLNTALFYIKMDITDLQCKICSQNLESLDDLMQHLQEEHEKKLFMESKNYIVPFKFDSDMLRCFICLNKFYGFKSLLEHMNVHYRNFVCDVCDAGFITRSRLAKHAKNHETGEFRCQFCERVFPTLPKKKYHEGYVHSVTLSIKCGHCPQRFKHYHQKSKHLLEVHSIAQTEIKCHECDRTFNNQKAYRNHTKRDHEGERRFMCTQCAKKFFTLRELQNHMIMHSGTKKYQCEICSKTYGRKDSLRSHMRIHANDRRFKCEHCEMAFVQKCTWRAHVRAKHGEQV